MKEQVPDGLRSSATGRVPQWVLDEADGRAVQTVPFRAPAAHRPPGATRSRGLLSLLGVGGLVALGVLLVTYEPLTEGSQVVGPLTARQGPPAGFEEGPKPDRVRSVPGGSAEGQAYRFSAHQADGRTPVTWSPCRPVHLVVRPDNAPAGGAGMLARAVEAVSAATGLSFTEDGATDEPPSEGRQAYQPQRYGDRWAPVLVAWATPDEVPDFGVDIAGEAGAVSVTTPSGDRTYVSGVVYLDPAKLSGIAARAGTGAATAVIAHELGHLAGLAHVNDPAQVMYPRGGRQRQFGAGDLAGLDQLGRGSCQPDV